MCVRDTVPASLYMWHVYTKALFKPATLEEPMNSKAPTANQHPKSPPRLSAQVSFSTNRSHSLGGCISVSVCERQSGEIPRAMDGVCSSFNNAFKTHLMCFFPAVLYSAEVTSEDVCYSV